MVPLQLSKNMKQFYETYADADEKLSPLVRELVPGGGASFPRPVCDGICAQPVAFAHDGGRVQAVPARQETPAAENARNTNGK